MSRTDHNWIRTYTGKKFWPTDPRPEDICIEDIAHHLSLICRYTGACKTLYTVGQHSLIVSSLCSGYRLEGLMHDAAEAYLNDLNKPVKETKELEGYRSIEREVNNAIAIKFGLAFPWPYEVHEADEGAYRIETASPLLFDSGKDPYLQVIPMTPQEAEAAFLEEYEYLTRK